MIRTIAVIPARMASSRFPGKPLAPICGRPMIEHVYQRTKACDLLDEVYIATCDVEIANAAKGFGAKAIMTSSMHERACDRVAEASANDPSEIIVMIQGDEPMIQPEMIDAAIKPMYEDSSIKCVNLAATIQNENELMDPNTIKTVLDKNDDALYFSREPIPSSRTYPFKKGEWFKQVCIIPFRKKSLEQFASLPQGILEIAESIDMLRFLENGISVRMVKTPVQTQAVDTSLDLKKVESLMAGNSLYSYAKKSTKP